MSLPTRECGLQAKDTILSESLYITPSICTKPNASSLAHSKTSSLKFIQPASHSKCRRLFASPEQPPTWSTLASLLHPLAYYDAYLRLAAPSHIPKLSTLNIHNVDVCALFVLYKARATGSSMVAVSTSLGQALFLPVSEYITPLSTFPYMTTYHRLLNTKDGRNPD